MSLYWDDFERRIEETVYCLKNHINPPIRRVAVFITNKCNFRCKYCNIKFNREETQKEVFNSIINRYRDTSIIHITGGEPSMVDWLYDYIDHKEAKFHLNSNGFIRPPRNIKRLKISLDTCNENYFNNLVGRKNSFKRVIENIKYSCEYTTVSITCILSKETYLEIPYFIDFCNKEFPKLYAIFFSVYKGNNLQFIMNTDEVNIFFTQILPEMKSKLNSESLWLLNESLDEKKRVLQGIRFPENKINLKCYLCLSEKVFDYQGREYNCSHLFRDGILSNNSLKVKECCYGCNRKLVKFNEEIEQLLKNANKSQ
jgi:MoaA/NifB/PqqE/SkfB family radical SAM enzyme